MNTIYGFEVAVGPTGKQIVLGSNLSKSALVALLDAMMKDGRAFTFYDFKYPSPSDPGAYFGYFPQDGQWKMCLGNHGWSGGIYTINTEIVTNQIYSLYLQRKLQELDLEKVFFASHYAPEVGSKNEAMNNRLNDLHG